MLKVDDYLRIRTAHRAGMSVRAIARTYHHSRRKVRRVLLEAEPQPYRRSQEQIAPKLGAFKGVIEQILQDDEQAPRKQRHTAMKLYRRLRDEWGYRGGYDQVRRYVGRQVRQHRETFIPLAYEPGRRLEADFGHIHADFPEGRRQVPVFLATWSYSGFCLAVALPTERIEAILAGLVEAFTFFGCVPLELWWDNPKTVATAVLKGRQRQMHPRYAALASHYRFAPLFCMVRRPNEKPYVENSVFDLQRHWCTPVPKVRDYQELNAHLRACCLGKKDHCVAGQSETVGVRFAREQAAAAALPAWPFDPCLPTVAQVDKYQLARFDHNRYSVPRRWAFETVTVKAYVECIEIVAGGAVIARHHRCYDRGQQIIQPEHYLAILGRRPAALDHSGALRAWQLPQCFAELRRCLAAHHGPPAGLRQYVRVLQLLAEHPAQRVARAIDYCLGRLPLQAESIIQHTQRLARQAAGPDDPPPDDLRSDPVGGVQVPLPDLRRFDQLLTPDQGDDDHVDPRGTVVADESETVAFAHHAGGIRPTGPGGGPAAGRVSPLSAAPV